MHLKKGHAALALDHVAGMLGLETNTNIGGQRGRRVHETASTLFVVRAGWFGERGEARRTVARFADARLQVLGVSEPLPFGVEMVVQVPLATYFQALPW